MHFPPEKCHVGIVFQEYASFPTLQFHKTWLWSEKTAENVQRTRVTELLKMVDLFHYSTAILMNFQEVSSNVLPLQGHGSKSRYPVAR